MKKITKISQIPNKLKGERWKYVIPTNKAYAVSSMGRIFSFYKKHRKKNKGGGFLKQSLKDIKKGKYFVVIFCFNRTTLREKIHRTVLRHFKKNPNNLPFCNHINAITTDNRIVNLEWCDHNGNTQHAKKLGIYKSTCNRGEQCHNSLYTEKLVLKIRKEYESLKTKTKYAQKILAEKYNIDHRQIWKMVHRKTWTHI